MAAPTHVAIRTAPTGARLTDGISPYKSIICVAWNGLVNLFEIESGLPGVDCGENIDIATQWDQDWMPTRGRSRKKLTEFTMVCAYDPLVYNVLNSVFGVEGSITRHFPDSSSVDFYGSIRKGEFDTHKDGDMPKLTITVTPTNYDPVNKVTAGPVYNAKTGT